MMSTELKLNTVDLQELEQDPLRLPTEEHVDADWKEICASVKERDEARLKDYDSEIDTLLVFAGLFSTVLTAFIVDVYQDLKVDYEEVSVDVLRQILNQLQSQATDSSVELKPKATPSATVIVVICLWFTSLALSLLSALCSIFMKQWLHVSEKWTAVAQINIQQALALRSFYQASLTKWHIPDIFAALSVLLQVALLLFVIGMAAYLWTLNFVVSPVFTFFAVVMIILSALAIILPVLFEDCPYKFPLAYLLVKARTDSSARDWTERDLPIAQKHLQRGASPSSLDKAIAETALLLDIEPDCLRSALVSTSESTLKQTTLIKSRILELSAASSLLLSKIVTTTELLEEKLEKETKWQLLSLWKTVFGSMLHPQPTIIHALQYLEKHISRGKDGKQGKVLEIHYMAVLVRDILRQSSTLHCSEISATRLANELTRIALVVNEWADSAGETVGREFAARITLEAMIIAAACIPLDTHPLTGLSPLAPYLTFMDALGASVALAYDSRTKYDTSLVQLCDNGRMLHKTLSSHHAAFFCIRRRRFITPRTDEPRMINFISGASTRLFIGTDEPAAYFLDPNTEVVTPIAARLPSEMRLHLARISPDASRIYWGSREGPVVVVDSSSSKCSLLDDTSQGKNSRVSTFSHDNTHMLVLSDMNTATMCNTSSGEALLTFEGHAKRVARAAFAAVFSPSKPLEQGAGKAAAMGEVDELEQLQRDAARPQLVTSSCDNTVKVWDTVTGTCLTTFEFVDGVNGGVCWSNDARSIAVATSNCAIVYDVATHETKCTLKGHTDFVTDVVFSPNDTLLATASHDKTIRVWHVTKKYCIAVLEGPTDEVNDVKFSPDGRFIAAAADDAVWIWDINETTMFHPAGEATRAVAAKHGAAFSGLKKNKVDNVGVGECSYLADMSNPQCVGGVCKLK